jgi:glycosyltransferase involved in cell wall biosynthesis
MPHRNHHRRNYRRTNYRGRNSRRGNYRRDDSSRIDHSVEVESWLPEQRLGNRKIVWLVDPLSAIPGEGLLPSRTWALARAFVAAGHEVIWWTSGFSHARRITRTPPLKIVEEEGFSVRLIASRGYNSYFSFGRFASHRKFARGFEKQAIEGLASGDLARPDLLIATLPPSSTVDAAVRLANKLDAELLLDVDEWWPEPLRPMIPGPQWFAHLLASITFPIIARKQKDSLQLVDAILAGSQTTKNAVVKATTSPPPIEVIPTGAYLQDYPRPPHFIDHVPHAGHEQTQPRDNEQNQLAIAVAGDIDQKSDIFLLTDLARALSDKNINAVFHVIGGGRWMPRLETAAPLLTGSCSIQCHGRVDRSRYVGILSECHAALVLPGRLNHFPLPVETSDYAAAGLVLLLTHNGELADLVLGAHAGVLTNSQPEALAAAIAPLATDPQQIARFRQASRKLAETFLDREKLAAKAVVWLESLAELDPVNPL